MKRASRPGKARWSALAIAAAAVAVAGVAALTERAPARVTLVLTLSEVGYTIATAWSVYDLRAASVQVSGMAPVRMEVDVAELARRDSSTDAVTRWSRVELRGGIAVEPRSGATISPRLRSDFLSVDLAVEPRTWVRIAALESGARGMRIEATGGKTSGTISVGKVLELQCDGCIGRADGAAAGIPLTDTLRLQMSRRQIAASPAGEQTFAVALDRTPGSGALPVTGLKVDELRFYRVLADGKAESTLTEDGIVTFAGSKSPPEKIRRDDLVRLRCDGPADVRSLQVSTQVKVEIDCAATVLRTGLGPDARSRLPSYLRWWYTNETVALLVGAVTSLAAAIVGILKWFGASAKA